MKPFDLEAAKRGEPIVCRDGTPAKFVRHEPELGHAGLIVIVGGCVQQRFTDGTDIVRRIDKKKGPIYGAKESHGVGEFLWWDTSDISRITARSRRKSFWFVVPKNPRRQPCLPSGD